MDIESVWLQYNYQLKLYILSKTRDESIADDLVHEVFLKVNASLAGLKEEDRVVAWLYRITHHVIVDYFRAQKKTKCAGVGIKVFG